MPLSPSTYVPRQYRSQYAGTIGQLLGQNNSALWGNTINTLGGIASDAFRQRAEDKQADARHQAEIGLIDAYKQGSASKEIFAKTLGKDGLTLWNGLESATVLAEGRTRSAREDMKNVLDGFVNASSPQTQAMLYPELKRINSVAKLIPPDQVPDEWNPQTSEMVSGLYHSLVPKKEVNPLEINGQLVDPNTREVLGDYRNEPTPPAPKASTWVVRGGKVIPIQPGTEQPGDRPYEKPGAPGSLRSITVQNEAGDNVLANYDPKTGRYFDTSGVEIKNPKKPLGAVESNRAASAETVSRVGQDLIQKLDDSNLAALFGPGIGRFNNLREFIGNPPPEFAEFAAEIESFSLANMGVHGMRSAVAAEKIKALYDGKHTPEAIQAGLRGLIVFSNEYMKTVGRESRVPTGSLPSPAPTAGKPPNPFKKPK